MRNTTLNGITRSYLLQTNRPIHYYIRCLKFASDCLRELLFDTLQITNTVRLPVNSLFEASIPNDYIDWVKVGTQVGQFVRPLIKKDSFNRLANFNTTTADQITYPQPFDSDQNSEGWRGNGFRWFGVNINTNGENTGGYYGLGAGSEPDTFTIVEERNVIQLNQNITDSVIVLEYISDGSYANAATQITPYAQRTIEAYIDWQYKINSKSYGMGDANQAEQIFYNELRKLRARKSDLTPDILIRIINRNRKASLK